MRNSTPARWKRLSFGGALAALLVVSLLSAGAATTQEPQAASNLTRLAGPLLNAPEKPVESLLDSRLEQLTEIERREGATAAQEFARVNGIPLDESGLVQVLIHESVEREYGSDSRVAEDPEQRIGRSTYGEEALFELLEVAISEEIANNGGSFHGRVGNLIDASVPIPSLRNFNDAFGVGHVQVAPMRRLNVVSEGVNVIQATALQNSSVNVGGEPVKVGIIDLGFKGYEDLLGTELPATVTTASFHPGGLNGDGESLLDQVHGTACAEIIFDIVPEAEIFLANFDTISDNDDAVDWMIEQDVDVISYSIGWYNAGPGDGRGPVNAAVDRAVAAGIEFVTSAGNEARDHWEGTFNDSDGDTFHNFAPGDNSNAVFLNAGEELTVFLNWDDWFASDQDYDLYIVDSNDNLVAFSTGNQTGTQNPAESTGFIAPASDTYHVLISRFNATRNVELEMFFFVGPEMQYIVPQGSITIPADSEDAVSVGATYWGDDVIEDFSSLGPTSDGRMKPDIVAPDGVATVSYQNLGFAFFGTSASAPHAAGAIALMKSRFGVFTLPQIREILYGRAIDKGVAGQDNTYGRGRLDIIGQ